MLVMAMVAAPVDLDDIMREIDEDGQGTISKEELLEFLKKLS